MNFGKKKKIKRSPNYFSVYLFFYLTLLKTPRKKVGKKSAIEHTVQVTLRRSRDVTLHATGDIQPIMSTRGLGAAIVRNWNLPASRFFYRRGMEPGSEEVVFPEEEPFRTFPYRARFVYHIKSVFHARDKMQYTLRHGSWCTPKVLPYISGKKGASARCLHP